ncbi:hypothetical protein [Streptomyces sp. CBMA156]|uniref:hypothetical protein n=1 Tax=Streptomyces sp. CBMA156 TaxID=1930280 RepID=UPI001661E542|nr:hypothetical protein [Streptomyces sp. CBMA156]MBD0674763.1 hypothetical protein [Streptomyces sp. CBMA156]
MTWGFCLYCIRRRRRRARATLVFAVPFEHLEVELAFPAGLGRAAWGTETSMTAEAVLLWTATF